MARSLFGKFMFCSSLLLTSAAMAQDWTIDKQHSQVDIVGKTPNSKLSGTINKWDGKIIFDPNHLDESHVLVNVDVSSIRTNDHLFDRLLPDTSWLATQRFPLATFESNSITHVEGDAYQASGTLMIRGVSQNVTLPFTVQLNDQTAHAQGVLTLLRTDFGIGGGVNEPPDFGITIGVKFDLNATK